MGFMDNYEIARDRAQTYFLNFDQNAIIQKWNLRFNDDFLFVTFLGRPYSVCRRTGRIDRLFDGKQAGFSEVLSIFDLLCHTGKDPFVTGKFAPVNSLRGSPATGGVGTKFHSNTAARFDRDIDGLIAACCALGGEPVDMGDIGFAIPVFGPLKAVLKFYRSDEEFPADLTILWDENMLSFMFYETVFYVAGFLLDTMLKERQKDGQ